MSYSSSDTQMQFSRSYPVTILWIPVQWYAGFPYRLPYPAAESIHIDWVHIDSFHSKHRQLDKVVCSNHQIEDLLRRIECLGENNGKNFLLPRSRSVHRELEGEKTKSDVEYFFRWDLQSFQTTKVWRNTVITPPLQLRVGWKKHCCGQGQRFCTLF